MAPIRQDAERKQEQVEDAVVCATHSTGLATAYNTPPANSPSGRKLGSGSEFGWGGRFEDGATACH